MKLLPKRFRKQFLQVKFNTCQKMAKKAKAQLKALQGSTLPIPKPFEQLEPGIEGYCGRKVEHINYDDLIEHLDLSEESMKAREILNKVGAYSNLLAGWLRAEFLLFEDYDFETSWVTTAFVESALDSAIERLQSTNSEVKEKFIRRIWVVWLNHHESEINPWLTHEYPIRNEEFMNPEEVKFYRSQLMKKPYHQVHYGVHFPTQKVEV